MDTQSSQPLQNMNDVRPERRPLVFDFLSRGSRRVGRDRLRFGLDACAARRKRLHNTTDSTLPCAYDVERDMTLKRTRRTGLLHASMRLALLTRTSCGQGGFRCERRNPPNR